MKPWAPQTKTIEQDQAKRYDCPNCGTNIAYDVNADGVTCTHCGYIALVQVAVLGKAAVVPPVWLSQWNRKQH